MKLVSQTPKRIEVKVKLAYSDRRVKSSGEIRTQAEVIAYLITILNLMMPYWKNLCPTFLILPRFSRLKKMVHLEAMRELLETGLALLTTVEDLKPSTS